jgi:hypothetical protein
MNLGIASSSFSDLSWSFANGPHPSSLASETDWERVKRSSSRVTTVRFEGPRKERDKLSQTKITHRELAIHWRVSLNTTIRREEDGMSWLMPLRFVACCDEE